MQHITYFTLVNSSSSKFFYLCIVLYSSYTTFSHSFFPCASHVSSNSCPLQQHLLDVKLFVSLLELLPSWLVWGSFYGFQSIIVCRYHFGIFLIYVDDLLLLALLALASSLLLGVVLDCSYFHVLDCLPSFLFQPLQYHLCLLQAMLPQFDLILLAHDLH